MKLIRSIIFCCIVLSIAQLNGAQTSETKLAVTARLYGYTTQSSDSEQEWEKKFQDGIVADNIRENMRRMSARPHHVGSPYDKDNAEWILAKFKEWGFDAQIETFQVLFPTPKERVVELVEPTQFRAKLQEPAVGGRSHLESSVRATADLQCLLDRWRRDRATGVRELRKPRRL